VLFDRGVELKTPAQLRVMREAGLVVAHTLARLRDQVAAGMTTGDLDAIARDAIAEMGATSNFLGYHGFPGVICTSVNDEVVHGIPGDRVIADGDVVSIDCGAVVDGWHGDSAVTVAVGEVPDDVAGLLRVTERAMWHGIAAARDGGRVGDVGHAVQSYVADQGDYGIVTGYTGHGIGTAMHQPPDVPNVGRAGKGARLRSGMAIAVEPMITLGTAQTRTLEDEWTVVSLDGSWAAHFEHSVAITEDGLWVLTAPDGGREALAALGAPYAGD
jgi:methionyl aminopeptidase